METNKEHSSLFCFH